MDSMSESAHEQGPPICRRCGGSLIEVRCPTGPHYAELRCSACGRHHKFLAGPWTRERAEAFRMTFGLYAGTTFGELAQTQSGREYLRWIADNRNGNAGTAARIILENLRS